MLVTSKEDPTLLWPARALLDSGSGPSFIAKWLCDKLNLKTVPTFDTISGIAAQSPAAYMNKALSVRVENSSGNGVIFSPYVLDKVLEPLPGIPDLFQLYPSLQPYAGRMAEEVPRGPGEIDLILGQDIRWAVLDGTVVRPEETPGTTFGPVLTSTLFGLVCEGRVGTPGSNEHSAKDLAATAQDIAPISVHAARIADMRNKCCQHKDNDDLALQLEQFWTLEHMGVAPDEAASEKNPMEELAMERFTQTLRYCSIKKQYSTILLFTPDGESSNKSALSLGPFSRTELRLCPVGEGLEASNTTLTFVLLDESLSTAR